MRRVLFVLLLVLVAGAFVSCDLDALFGEDTLEETPENMIPEEGDLTVYNNLQDDTKEAVDKIGEVYEVIAPEVARFFNGQELIDRFRDENGNPTPLIFNSWLVAYKSLTGWVPEVFEKAPKNAMFHNSHGYKDLSELPKDLRYVEFCEFRYLETNEYHSAGDICFIELRLVDGGVVKGSYYAKALSFDPTLRYEISTFGLDLLTGKHISYDYNKREIGPPRYFSTYDDDGKLVKVTYLNEDGTVRRWDEIEYNQEGFKILHTIFDGSGSKLEETHLEGISKGKILYTLAFDETGEPYEKTLCQYSKDGKTDLRYLSFSLIDPLNPLTSEEFTPKSNPDADIQIRYDNSGNRQMQHEFIGETNREIWFYPSGHIKLVEERDKNWKVVSSTPYEDGNVHRIDVASMEDLREEVETISFTTADSEYSLYIPVHLAFGVEPSNMVVEILVVDNEGHEIELDSSTYSIKFFGENETVDITGENNLVYKVPSEKWIESINVTLEKNADIEATLKVKICNNVILIGQADSFRQKYALDVPNTTNKDFFVDFSTFSGITVNTDDIFWYVISKEGYEEDLSLEQAMGALMELIPATGVDAGNLSDTWFDANYKKSTFELSVVTDGSGTSNHDIVAFFIFVQYTGTETTNVGTLKCSDLKELVKVPIVFCK
jgi:hypothetical protein